MKMVKSLLLGTAAGLVAIAGAQAADLPVKAKPAQYVKICSLYGAGFYYIPGTDTCVKMGGFVRAEWMTQAGGSFTPYIAGGQALFNRNTSDLVQRTRGIISWDVRSQTQYGTLRGYLRGGFQWTSNDSTTGGSAGVQIGPPATTASTAPGAATAAATTVIYVDRAFVQLGGWTFGKTQSFYDFFNTPAYSNQTSFLWRDTGGLGTPLVAFTASFGNGISATLSLEDYTDNGRAPIVGIAPATYFGGFTLAGVQAGNSPSNRANIVPDVVGALRVDQAWGSAQIAAVAHSVFASYYPLGNANGFARPGNEYGVAVGGGVTFNLPMITKGDDITIAGNYCSAAVRYCLNGSAVAGSGAIFSTTSGNVLAFGFADDGYFNTTPGAFGSIEKSRAYNVQGGVRHFWMPNLNTSVAGGYAKYEANSATINAACAVAGFAAGCLDWSAWTVSTRTTWNPVANLDLSLEALYYRVKSAAQGGVLASGTAAPGVPAAFAIGDVGHWSGIFRVQRNFWP